MGREESCPGRTRFLRSAGFVSGEASNPSPGPRRLVKAPSRATLSARQRAAFTALTFAICALPFDLIFVSCRLSQL
jgi:hypothetical protein